MAQIVYYSINFTATSNAESDVFELFSTQEEPATIKSLLIQQEDNSGTLKMYQNRKRFGDHIIGHTTLQNFLEIPIERKLAVGEYFKLTSTNMTAGVHVSFIALVKVEIE